MRLYEIGDTYTAAAKDVWFDLEWIGRASAEFQLSSWFLATFRSEFVIVMNEN